MTNRATVSQGHSLRVTPWLNLHPLHCTDSAMPHCFMRHARSLVAIMTVFEVKYLLATESARARVEHML